MRSFLSAVAISFFAYGLWEHDWRILFASALIAFIWPFVKDEVRMVAERRHHRELLEHLWDDDDDLPSSA